MNLFVTQHHAICISLGSKIQWKFRQNSRWCFSTVLHISVVLVFLASTALCLLFVYFMAFTLFILPFATPIFLINSKFYEASILKTEQQDHELCRKFWEKNSWRQDGGNIQRVQCVRWFCSWAKNIRNLFKPSVCCLKQLNKIYVI